MNGQTLALTVGLITSQIKKYMKENIDIGIDDIRPNATNDGIIFITTQGGKFEIKFTNLNFMSKNEYDKDNDGVIDYANKSKTSEIATVSKDSNRLGGKEYTEYFEKILDTTDNIKEGENNKFLTQEEKDKLSHLPKNVNLELYDKMNVIMYDSNKDGIVDKAETLKGLELSVEELNNLQNIINNVQKQVNSLSSIGNFTGLANSYESIKETNPNPSAKDMIIVINDIKHNNSSSIYIYNKEWEYAGNLTAKMRDFNVDPIDLKKEVIGVLSEKNIDESIARKTYVNALLTDKIDKNKDVESGNIAIFNEEGNIIDSKRKPSSFANSYHTHPEIAEELHFHSNKEILDKLSTSVDGKLLYNGKLIEGSNINDGIIGEKYEILKVKPVDVIKNKLYFIQEGENVNAYIGKYDGTLQLIGTKLGDTSSLPSELQNKTVMEMLTYLFTCANSDKDGKLLIGNAIGKDYTNLSYVSISNDIIDQKKNIANALKSKGVSANDYEELSSYSDKINSIVQHPTVKNTKLNVIAPLTKELKLTNPTQLENLCISVLEYQAGEKDTVKYNCAFDNGDKSNFTNTKNMIFDGQMKQDTQNKKFYTTLSRTEETFTEYITDVDIESFYTVNSMDFEENETGENSVNIKGTYLPNLVFAKGDIDLTGVDRLTKIEWKAISEGNNKLKMLMSIDSGITWCGYNTKTKEVEKVNIEDNDDIKNKGLSIGEVNNLTVEDLDNLRNNSPKMRFAYYFDIKDINSETYNDEITLTVDMKGKNIPSKNFDYEISEDGQTVKVAIYKDGTYTIIHCDNN